MNILRTAVHLVAMALLALAGATASAQQYAADELSKASSADSPWVNLGIGGSGAFFQPAGSPHDPNLVFVSSDMGQLLRSTDAGKNWRMVDWRSSPHVKSPVFHPTDPNIMWACDWGGDVLRVSRDKGVVWQVVGGAQAPWKGQQLVAIAIGRANPRFMLLSTDKGVFRSIDGGEKWEAVANAPGGLMGIFIDPASPADKPVCIGGSKVGVYRSDDGGLSWVEKSVGLPQRDLRAFCGGSDGKKTMVYCLLPSRNVGGKVVGGVWRSADGGEKWESAMGEGIRTKAGNGPDQFMFMGMAQTNPDILYVTNTGTDDPPPNHYTVFRTDDAGKTWKDCFYNDPRQAGSNSDVGWLLYDRSRGFGDRALGFGVNAGDPDEVFYTNFGEVFMTTNGGKSWYQTFTRRAEGQGQPGAGQRWESCGSEDTTCWRYVFDPFDKNRTYICYTDIGFARSEDRGKSWLYDSKGRPCTNTTYDLAADPDVPGVFWGAFSDMHDIPTWRYVVGAGRSRGGIAKSTDHCKSWISQNSGMPVAPATAIVIDPTSPKDGRTLYAGIYGHGVFKSTDGGATWMLKSSGIEPAQNRQVYSIRRWKDGTLFCTVAARRSGGGVNSNLAGGLFMSSDGAESWKRLSNEEMYRCVDFAVDPEDRNIIYVATMDGLAGKGGVYKTSDGGNTWANCNVEYDKSNLNYIEGMTVTINPQKRNVLYFCAMTHGMFLSKDAGKTWSALGPAKSPPFLQCTRLFWDPEDIKTVYVVTFGGGVWKGPDPGVE